MRAEREKQAKEGAHDPPDPPDPLDVVARRPSYTLLAALLYMCCSLSMTCLRCLARGLRLPGSSEEAARKRSIIIYNIY